MTTPMTNPEQKVRRERISPSSKTYLAIDLKSFYASVECVDRGLDPLTANLVVADESRTDKTVCLAVSPSLKRYGISGRARLFEVKRRVREVNAERRRQRQPELKFIIAPPRMAKYIEVSTQIYAIYLDFVAPEDIFVYSIDEVFIDATPYLKIYQMDGEALAGAIIAKIAAQTGITATAGVGTNLYLAKVAMDILAKHAEPDAHGVRMASLTEASYREQLWAHTPLTDFWRVGPGYQRRLAQLGLRTMGDICLASQTAYGEDRLFKAFGVNAELLIDHAWGYEPTELADIKQYRPRENSLGSGQVLKQPYVCAQAAVVLREMAEALALKLVQKQLATDQLVLTVGYDHTSAQGFTGELVQDRHGRRLPKPAHGTENLGNHTNSTRRLVAASMDLFERIINPTLRVRRLNLVANHVLTEQEASSQGPAQQLSLFTRGQVVDFDATPAHSGLSSKTDKNAFLDDSPAAAAGRAQREHRLQEAELAIKAKFGKNAILKGTDFKPGATTRERNQQIGGHRA